MEILIEKSARLLSLIICDRCALTFPISLGSSPQGAKEREGDGRTPEGRYYVCTRNEKSKYHLSLGLSYPNPDDAETALSRGDVSREQYDAILAAHAAGLRPPWDTPMGGFIMIHGGGSEGDWTAGCIALDNADIETLFALWRKLASVPLTRTGFSIPVRSISNRPPKPPTSEQTPAVMVLAMCFFISSTDL